MPARGTGCSPGSCARGLRHTCSTGKAVRTCQQRQRYSRETPFCRKGACLLDLARLEIDADSPAGGNRLGESNRDRSWTAAAIQETHAGSEGGEEEGGINPGITRSKIGDDPLGITLWVLWCSRAELALRLRSHVVAPPLSLLKRAGSAAAPSAGRCIRRFDGPNESGLIWSPQPPTQRRSSSPARLCPRDAWRCLLPPLPSVLRPVEPTAPRAGRRSRARR